METVALTEAADIRAVHEELLRPTFRPGELVALDKLLAAVAAGTCEVLVAVEDGERAAVAIGDFAGGLALLSYLAVSQTVRSRGLGGRLLDEVVSRWRERFPLVVAEVDRPDCHDSDPLQGDPQRRLDFYDRHGALALDLPYFQASLGEGQPREYCMLLLVLAADPSLLSQDGSRLAEPAPLRSFLQGVLGHPDESDAAAVRLLNAAGAPDGIALLPLARYGLIEASRP